MSSKTSNFSANQDTNAGTQYTNLYAGSLGGNQGIIDGRPEGQQPPPATTTMDTFVDKDASGPTLNEGAAATIQGATSQEVSESTGKPGTGMSSKELRHDGMPKRKNPGQGLDDTGYGQHGRGKEAAQDEGLRGFKVE